MLTSFRVIVLLSSVCVGGGGEQQHDSDSVIVGEYAGN